jgi:enterochelin esterase-like enzyme
MIGPFPNPPAFSRGRVDAQCFASRLLHANPWNDPTARDLFVYLPPGYGKSEERYPVVLLLAGFTGNGERMLARGLTELSIAARIDRLLERGCPPFIAVLPDCMTTLGGSQYVDSPALGSYASYLVEEVRRFVDGRYRTTGRWGVAGKSSGGFGALHLAMAFPGVFEAVACHSGDMGFDLCYLEDIAGTVRALRAAGGVRPFLSAFWQKPDLGSDDFHALNILCMACAYASHRVAGNFPARLPVDVETGVVDFAVLESWRVYDPIDRLDSDDARQALRTLRLLHVDCGDRDEHLLHLGARRFVRGLADAGIAHTYEEFPGGHRATTHRYDVSLPRLARVLSQA